MAKALVFLAEGFEEIEAVTVVDVLRRADVQVDTAALGHKRVLGAHGIAIEAELLLDEVVAKGQGQQLYDALILPGGMPGARHLRDDARVKTLITQQHQSGRIVAAICAAPIAHEAAGVPRGKAATAYPGYALESAKHREDRLGIDADIGTCRGPGTALEFALTLVEQLVGGDKAAKLRSGMVVA